MARARGRQHARAGGGGCGAVGGAFLPVCCLRACRSPRHRQANQSASGERRRVVQPSRYDLPVRERRLLSFRALPNPGRLLPAEGKKTRAFGSHDGVGGAVVTRGSGRELGADRRVAPPRRSLGYFQSKQGLALSRPIAAVYRDLPIFQNLIMIRPKQRRQSTHKKKLDLVITCSIWE
jgi:hypothetical protein